MPVTVNTPTDPFGDRISRADRYPTGDDWQHDESGRLTVYDTEGHALATYQPHAWANVTWRPARTPKTTETKDADQ